MLALVCFEESVSWCFLAGFSDNVSHILVGVVHGCCSYKRARQCGFWGSGCRRLARRRLYAEDRGLQVPMDLEHHPVTSRGKAAPGPDPRIIHRIEIVMFCPIRVDHTNCLRVVIKTHSFILETHIIPDKPTTCRGFPSTNTHSFLFKSHGLRLRQVCS
jgi:hypothetical protein